MTSKGQTKIEKKAFAALAVINLTPATHEWLRVNDPMALKQVNEAMTAIADGGTPEGPSLRGYLHITFDELVERCGQPETEGCSKTRAAFRTKFDGLEATIYCYKEEEVPKGLYAWHVSGLPGHGLMQACVRELPDHFVETLMDS
jgi:hypothetical protein